MGVHIGVHQVWRRSLFPNYLGILFQQINFCRIDHDTVSKRGSRWMYHLATFVSPVTVQNYLFTFSTDVLTERKSLVAGFSNIFLCFISVLLFFAIKFHDICYNMHITSYVGC